MKSKGFRQIDNELFTALIAAKWPGSVYQIVLTIIDRTIGFQEEKAPISLSKFQHLTGLSRQGVVDAIQYASDRNIIRREGEKGSGKTIKYALNRDQLVNPTLLVNSSLLVNPALLDQSTLLDQTSQPPIAGSTMPKETSKETIKEKKTAVSFEEYKQQLRERFSDLDFDIELEKFNHYWSEGDRKLKRPKFSLLNWMLKARKIKAQEVDRGAHRQSPRQLRPRGSYTQPEDYRA